MTVALNTHEPSARADGHIDGLVREIGASLTVIRGECHAMVRSGLASGARIDRLRMIDRQAERIALALHNVHDLVYTDRQIAPATGQCHLGEIATRAVERLATIAHSRDVPLTVRVSDDGPVQGRRDALDRVLEHVLIHAITAAGHGGRVGVRLRVVGRIVRLNVTARRGDKGAGSWRDDVGMQIVRSQVAHLGGTASHADTSDRMVCRIALPLARA